VPAALAVPPQTRSAADSELQQVKLSQARWEEQEVRAHACMR
jgi:hypothetical protein